VLWSFDAQTAVMAQPITYRAGGRQYIAVVAGSRYPSAQGFAKEWNYRELQWRVLAFALGGKDRLPAAEPIDRSIPRDSSFAVDPALARAGASEYADRCAACHGANALSGGAAPDLLRSPIPLDVAGFTELVRTGPMISRGMPGFAELGDRELAGIAHYLRRRALEVAAGEKPVNTNDERGQ
jgi:quinohemoprotein ethanol dehydrogenase